MQYAGSGILLATKQGKSRMLISNRIWSFDLVRAAAAVIVALVLPTGCGRRSAEAGEQATIAQLAARAESANAAFINGDMRRWWRISGPIADDFTLMQPLGGFTRGFDPSPAHLDQLAHTFTRGEATFELVQGYATRDMAVLVFIERQRAEVAGLPEQDWSLRVTQVWRRRADTWELAHRHADVLVNKMAMDRTAVLAQTD
jgi:ketosteroid isomerase-like protein